jgi:hypothetical protein
MLLKEIVVKKLFAARTRVTYGYFLIQVADIEAKKGML